MRERAPKILRGPVPRNKEDDQVVYIDTDSAPRILFSGEDLLLEDLPIGTRVIYPKPPIEGLANPGAAIRYALNHPQDTEPLYAQLAPGMQVTIAVDDICLPLPPMPTPDIRQTIIEIVLELLDDNGVDDVHIIIANSLHRRMTDAEMKRMVGDEDLQRVLSRPLLQPRRRGSRRHRAPGQDRPPRAGEHQPPLRRERPGHLRQHQPRADGRRPQVGGGRPVRLREPAPAPRAADHSRLRQLHGSEAVEAEREGRAPGRAGRPAHERVPHRDGAQQPHVRRRHRVPDRRTRTSSPRSIA